MPLLLLLACVPAPRPTEGADTSSGVDSTADFVALPTGCTEGAGGTDPVTLTGSLAVPSSDPGQAFMELVDVDIVGNVAYAVGQGGLLVGEIGADGTLTQLHRDIGVEYRALSNRGGLESRFGRRGDEGMALVGERLYVANRTDGTVVYDIRDPAHPIVGAAGGGGTATWELVAVERSLLYGADNIAGLVVIDIQEPDSPRLLEGVPGVGGLYDVAVDEAYAYGAAGGDRVVVFDLANPAAPVAVAWLVTGGSAVSVAVENDVLWVADHEAVGVWDVRDPLRPSPIGWEEVQQFALALDAHATGAVVGDWGYFESWSADTSATAPAFDTPLDTLRAGNGVVEAVITNRGNGALTLTDALTEGGEVWVSPSATLAPGESATLRTPDRRGGAGLLAADHHRRDGPTLRAARLARDARVLRPLVTRLPVRGLGHPTKHLAGVPRAGRGGVGGGLRRTRQRRGARRLHRVLRRRDAGAGGRGRRGAPPLRAGESFSARPFPAAVDRRRRRPHRLPPQRVRVRCRRGGARSGAGRAGRAGAPRPAAGSGASRRAPGAIGAILAWARGGTVMSRMEAVDLRNRTLLVLGLLPLWGCGEPATECMAVPANGECPSAAEASDTLLGDHCGYTVNAVTGEGELTEVPTWDTGAGQGTREECCYPTLEAVPVGTSCVVGRPYIDATGEKVAPARSGRGWARGRRPDVRRLTAAERAVLAAAWTEDALVEHASVAAFARTTLELMALGAPAELLAGAQAAAADEVRHARLSFALASAYAGREVEPAGFPVGARVEVNADPAAVAAATFREGCVGETVVALLSARAAEAASDPAARGLLALIARDEARHAELAWRTLGWLVRTHGAPVRAALAAEVAALRERGVRLTQVTSGAPDAVLAAHGRIRPHAAEEVRRAAVEEVILPCVDLLLLQAAEGGAEDASAGATA